MTALNESEINHAVAAGGSSAFSSSRRTGRRQAIALRWPSTPSERERTFHEWEGSAMRLLRSTGSDFSVIIALRNALKPDGNITASNAELAVAAGCSHKTLEFDLGRLKGSGLIICVFRPLRGFSGQRRIIRLSLPAPDGTAGRT